MSLLVVRSVLRKRGLVPKAAGKGGEAEPVRPLVVLRRCCACSWTP